MFPRSNEQRPACISMVVMRYANSSYAERTCRGYCSQKIAIHRQTCLRGNDGIFGALIDVVGMCFEGASLYQSDCLAC